MINKETKDISKSAKFLLNKSFQRLVIGLVVLFVSYLIVLNGAQPKKFKIEEGMKSPYTVYAPRTIEDRIATKKNQEAAAVSVTPKYSKDDLITNNAIQEVTSLFDSIIYLKTSSENQEQFIQGLIDNFKRYNININVNQAIKLSKLSEFNLQQFADICKQAVKNVMVQGITEESLERSLRDVKEQISKVSFLTNEYKELGNLVCSKVIKPNMIEDMNLTERARQEARSRESNTVKYEKGQIIIAKDEIVAASHIDMLKSLNIIKVNGKIDLPFYLGIFMLLAIIGTTVIIYLYNYQKDIWYSRGDLLLVGIIFLITLLLARGVSEISVYLIPVSFAAILISILLNVQFAVFINLILTVLVGIITKGDVNFIFISLIGGTFAAFAVAKADQRKKLVLAGTVIAFAHGAIIMCLGIVNKEVYSSILQNSGAGIMNGFLSTVLAIGTLPFWESTFNIITPLKLLELSNPNQPLIKRLLLEAPGTYHHSLMVGNLAEVATEAIGGNALLARVAAYFHDVGKLKRPYFFKENQYADNPHERMTASLSTMVITSHTKDGVELAEQNGVPLAIIDIIRQHHGTTLVTYFFHKAKNIEGLESQIKQDSFRYEGPRPTSKEAAVVMLADSVEAAVRSMRDKSEGKMEGLVRKIIKDKLEDGQLDLCDLTLKDFDIIAKSFMKVFSGCFHGRDEYPKVNVVEETKESIRKIDPLDIVNLEQNHVEKGEA